jgi:hypothetical protein
MKGHHPQDRSATCSRRRGRGNAATVLGLDKSAPSKRYTRDLERLKEILAALPGESRAG